MVDSENPSGNRAKHFLMLRSFHLADLLTIANGCCGMAAIFWAMNFVEAGNTTALYVACGLIPAALAFDVLDGRVARWRQKASPMGRELDSLADIISFGVAPAAIAYALGLRHPLDQLLLLLFVACGISRLARYNITAEDLSKEAGKVTYFEGTPIPTSVVPLFASVVLWRYELLGEVEYGPVAFHIGTLLYLVSGSLMISKTVRIPKP